MKPGQRVRLGLKRLHVGGFSWREIGKCIGKSGGATWLIAHGDTRLDEEAANRILEMLPKRLFWEGPEGLDAGVVALLKTGLLMTGRDMAKLLGTTDRTIRKSIKRLRDAGHNIGASMKPPRGYSM